MKERITKKMIDMTTWNEDEEFKKAWEYLSYWGENNLPILNKMWKKSSETNWKTFIINYAKEI
jgi:hypothetical protein